MFAKTLLIAFVLALAVAVTARTSDSAGPEQRYVVKRYDTLWSIATTHYAGDPREAVWQIQERNRLAGATITPGQVLRLP
ncbi:MAG TPA: LysM peptidoglycan-binding domain-containing protein [Vicinamibacterales bacterium]|jgi:nucleoid-associated protein YgaU|nr:LysM peptidoglycan-binding domain-containing protein [Vicinamibacterales bacterium]